MGIRSSNESDDPRFVEMANWILGRLAGAPRPLTEDDLHRLRLSAVPRLYGDPFPVLRWLLERELVRDDVARKRPLSHPARRYSPTERGLTSRLGFTGPTGDSAGAPRAFRLPPDLRSMLYAEGWVPGLFWDAAEDDWYYDPSALDPARIDEVLRGFPALGRKLPVASEPLDADELGAADPWSMTGAEFEGFLARLYERLGYRVRLTPATDDLGTSLIVEASNGRTAVHAERQDEPIGASAVEQAHAGRDHRRCTWSAVVTTSHFTPAAIALARRLAVDLHDGRRLRDTIAEATVKGRRAA